MPFLGKYFHQNSDDFGITNIDLIYAVFGINIDLIFAVFGKVRV